ENIMFDRLVEKLRAAVDPKNRHLMGFGHRRVFDAGSRSDEESAHENPVLHQLIEAERRLVDLVAVVMRHELEFSSMNAARLVHLRKKSLDGLFLLDAALLSRALLVRAGADQYLLVRYALLGSDK